MKDEIKYIYQRLAGLGFKVNITQDKQVIFIGPLSLDQYNLKYFSPNTSHFMKDMRP